MWFKRTTEAALKGTVGKLLLTIAIMERPSISSPIDLRCQGHHPVTGGLSVVYLRHSHSMNTMREVKHFLGCILFNKQHDMVDDFIARIGEKVEGAYSCGLKLSGYDKDGDTIDYELKFKSQSEFVQFLKNGALSEKDNDAKEIYSSLIT